jgi:hypothetical protein
MVVLSRSYAALREATREEDGREVEVGGALRGGRAPRLVENVVHGSPPGPRLYSGEGKALPLHQGAKGSAQGRRGKDGAQGGASRPPTQTLILARAARA